jgi:hypothetical protein
MDYIAPPGKVALEGETLTFRRGRLSSETESLPLDALRLVYLFFPTQFNWRPLRQSKYRYQYQNLDALSDDAFSELRAAISEQPGFLVGDFSFVLADFQGRVVKILWKRLSADGIDLMTEIRRHRETRREKLARWLEENPSITIEAKGGSFRASISVNAAGVAQGSKKFIPWNDLEKIEMSRVQSFVEAHYFRFVPHKAGRRKKIITGVSPKQAEACLAELDFWQSAGRAPSTEGARAAAEPRPAAPPASVQTSTLATVSLAAGIATWTLLPLIGALIAVVTGHLARKEIRESQGTLGGKRRSTAGLALGYTQLVLALLIPILMILSASSKKERPTATLAAGVRIVTVTPAARQATATLDGRPLTATSQAVQQATATARAEQAEATTQAEINRVQTEQVAATATAQAAPTLTPTPRPALAPTWTPAAEPGPQEVIAAYAEALRERDFEKAASLFSDFSLAAFGTNREAVQLEFEKRDFSGWRLLDYQIKGSRLLDEQTAMVQMFTKQQNSEGEQPQTLDFYAALRYEEGQWRPNLNNILYHTQLNVPAQTVNDVTARPTWIARYTDKVQLFFSVVNGTDRNVVWGDAQEKTATFHFADQSQDVTFTHGYAVGANANLPNVTVYVAGFFDAYPTAVELFNWRWARQDSPTLPDRSGETWSYAFSLPQN